MALRTALLSGSLLVGGGGALAVATDGFQAFTTEAARRVAVHRQPVSVPAVPLERASGAQFTLEDLRGKWVLVDFVYTRCITLCTMLGDDFAQIERRLAEPIADGKVQLLSISFDPANDTPDRLAAYVTQFGGRAPGWVAARPVTADGLRRLTAAFGVTVIPDGLGGYTHNAAIQVVDPAGRLVDIVDLGHPDRVAEVLRRQLMP